MTITEVGQQALNIMDAHAEGAYFDHGFDAGEFSEAMHDKHAHQEIAALAQQHGFTYDDVMEEINRLTWN